MRRRLAWSATEVVGMGVPNTRPVARKKFSPEEIEQLEREAAARGLSVDDHLNDLFRKAERAG